MHCLLYKTSKCQWEQMGSDAKTTKCRSCLGDLKLIFTEMIAPLSLLHKAHIGHIARRESGKGASDWWIVVSLWLRKQHGFWWAPKHARKERQATTARPKGMIGAKEPCIELLWWMIVWSTRRRRMRSFTSASSSWFLCSQHALSLASVDSTAWESVPSVCLLGH